MSLGRADRWQSGIGVFEEDIRNSSLRMNSQFTAGEDRREATRAYSSGPVQCRRAGSETDWRKCRSIDRSQNGVRLKLRAPISAGMILQLQMRLPDEEGLLRVKGRVVWVKPFAEDPALVQCGVAFEGSKRRVRRRGWIGFLIDQLRYAHRQQQLPRFVSLARVFHRLSS